MTTPLAAIAERTDTCTTATTLELGLTKTGTRPDGKPHLGGYQCAPTCAHVITVIDEIAVVWQWRVAAYTLLQPTTEWLRRPVTATCALSPLITMPKAIRKQGQRPNANSSAHAELDKAQSHNANSSDHSFSASGNRWRCRRRHSCCTPSHSRCNHRRRCRQTTTNALTPNPRTRGA